MSNHNDKNTLNSGEVRKDNPELSEIPSYCSDECKDIALQDKYLLRTYGIDKEQYERMYREQEGKCKICKGEGFVMDPSKHKVKLVVDHCHSSGAVRGLLCHNCNRGLGLLQDDIDSLKRESH